MVDTKPADFMPLAAWYDEQGKAVFDSSKMLHYHTKKIQRELIEAGAMAKVGAHLFLHKTRFWPCYQGILAANLSKSA